MRKRAITTLVTLACFGALGVGPAQAVEYANHVRVESGANYFGPSVALYAADTYPFGEAIGCAGIRYYGIYCPPNSHETASFVLANDVNSQPYIHNHATYTSYFSGYYHS